MHDISKRLVEAAHNGFLGVEIVEDDIETPAEKLDGGVSQSNRLDAERAIRP